MSRRRIGIVGSLLVLLGLSLPAPAVGIEFWRHQSAASFRSGRAEDVIVSDGGSVRLAPPLRSLCDFTAARVWDLARGPDGAIWAATGDQGRVFVRRGDAWEMIHDDPDSQVTSLTIGRDGAVWAGTGPGGRVLRLDRPGTAAERPGPEALYIWDLAIDRAGALLAATGPRGQLWRRDPTSGAWALLFDSPEPHLLSLAVADEGTIYAGSGGQGLIYRILPEGGRVAVVHDATQAEISALELGPDGDLYVGTGQDQSNPATSPAPKPGENTVTRLHIDGEGEASARELLRIKAVIYDLAWRGDRLAVATGPEGMVYQLDPRGEDVTPLVKIDHAQVLALEPDGQGGLLLGAGSPCAVFAVGAGCAPSGTLTSTILDAKLPARVGASGWRGDAPEGTAIALELRAGNSAEPDATWSAWSPAAESTTHARYWQYRLRLMSHNADNSPAVRAVSLPYQAINQAPELAKIEVPDVANLDGATRLESIEVKWTASDPNGDDLLATVSARKEGWPDWIPLTPKPIAESKYAWDAASLPEGRYEVKIRVDDRRANPPTAALTATRTSEPFLIDRTPPAITCKVADRTLKAELSDQTCRIARASYCIDGGEWTPAFASDGLFDTGAESLAITLDHLAPGPHVIMVRAVDAAGNPATADAILP